MLSLKFCGELAALYLNKENFPYIYLIYICIFLVNVMRQLILHINLLKQKLLKIRCVSHLRSCCRFLHVVL